MYETLTYTGGVHKSEEVKELIEDLGGFILQENNFTNGIGFKFTYSFRRC